MRITILDGKVLNPGDLLWTELEDLGSVTVYDRTEPAQVVERARDAEVIFTNKTALPASLLEELPALRYIGILATGYDVVDIAAAAKRGIPVCNVVAYGLDAVAQHVMALLLELSRGISEHDASVRAGQWSRCEDWCYWTRPLRDLSEMRMGIVGFGNIGRKVGQMAHAMGMEVLAYNRSPVPAPEYACTFMDMDDLFASADAISLHCPLNDASRGMISAQRLASMKRGSILINTARGPLLDEEAVANALHSGQLGGLGVDVLSCEPPSPDNPLLHAPHCLITPHVAWATLKARRNIVRLAAENLSCWQQGQLRNAVNASLL